MRIFAIFLLSSLTIASRIDAAEWEIRSRLTTQQADQVTIDATGVLSINTPSTLVADWYSLRRINPGPVSLPDQSHLQFLNGDRLAGRLREFDGNRLLWQAGVGTEPLRFPASGISRIWLGARPAWPDDERPFPIRDRDQFLLKSDDRQAGTLLSISGDTLKYQSNESEKQLPVSQVRCIILNTDLSRDRPLSGRHYRLLLNDGSILTALSLTLDKDQCRIKLSLQQQMLIPLASLREIRVIRGATTELTQLKPSKYDYSPYGGEQFSLGINRRPDGGPMYLGSYARPERADAGISLHAPARVEYALSGKFMRFECRAGLDADRGRVGSAKLIIETDPPLNSKQEYLLLPGDIRTIRLDLPKVQTLRLIADPATGGNVGDLINLVDALLINTEGSK